MSNSNVCVLCAIDAHRESSKEAVSIPSSVDIEDSLVWVLVSLLVKGHDMGGVVHILVEVSLHSFVIG